MWRENVEASFPLKKEPSPSQMLYWNCKSSWLISVVTHLNTSCQMFTFSNSKKDWFILCFMVVWIYLLFLPDNYVQILIMLSQKSLAKGLAVYLVAGSGTICMKYCPGRGHNLPFVDFEARYLVLTKYTFPFKGRVLH